MTDKHSGKVAVLYPGDYGTRQNATPENNRLAQVFQALASLRVHAEPAVYHDQFCEEVRQQLLRVDVVLVWMNPVQDGCDRTILDSMLREVAAAGVYVSAHPDIILKMGTKGVLYQTRDIGWGSDTHLYGDMEQLRWELPIKLASGQARVLKQYRGCLILILKACRYSGIVIFYSGRRVHPVKTPTYFARSMPAA